VYEPSGFASIRAAQKAEVGPAMSREELENIVLREFVKATTERQIQMFIQVLQKLSTGDIERWITKEVWL